MAQSYAHFISRQIVRQMLNGMAVLSVCVKFVNFYNKGMHFM